MPITLRSGITVGTGPPAEPFAPVKSDPFTEGLDEETTMRLAAWSMVRSLTSLRSVPAIIQQRVT